MHRFVAGVSLVLLLSTSPGCASGSRAAEPARSQGSRQSHQLGEQEIGTSQLGNAYDVVSRLRPQWLHTRGQPGAVRVYHNLSPVGGVGALRQISTAGLTSLRFLSGPDALIRFGRGHEAGAILVTSR